MSCPGLCQFSDTSGVAGGLRRLAENPLHSIPAVDAKYRWKLTSPTGDAGKWTFNPSSGERAVNAGEFQANNGSVPWEIAPTVTYQTGAGQASWVFEVSRDGETRKRTKTLVMAVKP